MFCTPAFCCHVFLAVENFGCPTSTWHQEPYLMSQPRWRLFLHLIYQNTISKLGKFQGTTHKKTQHERIWEMFGILNFDFVPTFRGEFCFFRRQSLSNPLFPTYIVVESLSIEIFKNLETNQLLRGGFRKHLLDMSGILMSKMLRNFV